MKRGSSRPSATLRDKEYAEIIEECETKFVKEIEFEHFRQNYTFEEAEEIEQDLEKIRRWFARIVERDWFGADRRGEVEVWIEKCENCLNGFEQEVYRRSGDDADGARCAVWPGSGLARCRAAYPRDDADRSEREGDGS